MFKILTNSDYSNLKIKLTLVYILNAIDIVFTFGLLKTGLFYEVNGFMSSVVESAFLSIFVKLIFPAIFILYILFKLDDGYQLNLRICNYLISFVLLMYFVIDCLHVFFTITYFLHL